MAMNKEVRRESILKAIAVFEEAAKNNFALKESIGAALAVGLSIANELHAIANTLEWQVEDTMGRREPRL